MKILTDKSLDEAIQLCKENERYRVLIVTKYVGDHPSILDCLSQSGADVVRRFDNSFARFLNGSNINLLSISSRSSVRGRKANLVLYQENVYDECEEMRYILASMEVSPISFKLSH